MSTCIRFYEISELTLICLIPTPHHSSCIFFFLPWETWLPSSSAYLFISSVSLQPISKLTTLFSHLSACLPSSIQPSPSCARLFPYMDMTSSAWGQTTMLGCSSVLALFLLPRGSRMLQVLAGSAALHLRWWAPSVFFGLNFAGKERKERRRWKKLTCLFIACCFLMLENLHFL